MPELLSAGFSRTARQHPLPSKQHIDVRDVDDLPSFQRKPVFRCQKLDFATRIRFRVAPPPTPDTRQRQNNNVAVHDSKRRGRTRNRTGVTGNCDSGSILENVIVVRIRCANRYTIQPVVEQKLQKIQYIAQLTPLTIEESFRCMKTLPTTIRCFV